MSSRLTLMSPAITIPLSRTRSRMSPRLAGWGPLRGPGLRAGDSAGAKLPWVISRFLSITAAARVPPDPSVGQQLSVRVDGCFVDRQDVGRRGNPLVLDEFDADGPAVFRALHLGDALRLLRGECRDLAQRRFGGLTGRHGLGGAAGRLPPLAVSRGFILILRLRFVGTEHLVLFGRVRFALPTCLVVSFLGFVGVA